MDTISRQSKILNVRGRITNLIMTADFSDEEYMLAEEILAGNS